MIKTRHMKASTKEEAWEIADMVFPTDYEKDEDASSRAEYPVYRSPVNHYDYICDLNTRLEINLSTGKTINIWIYDPTQKAREELARITKELYPN